MTAVDHSSIAPAVPAGGRLVAIAALALPPLMLLAVGVGLAFRGGGVAPEQWQPVAVGLAASLLVLSAVGAIPRIQRAALPTVVALVALLLWSAASFAWTASREATFEHGLRLAMLAGAAVAGVVYAARPRAALSLAAGLALCGAIATGAIEVKLLAGSTDAFVGSRLSWPINYANADAALVWLPLPALLAFAGAQPLRPLVRGGFAFFAALAFAVGLAAQSRGAAIALAGALFATVAIARDRARFALTLLAIAAPVAVLAPRMVGGDAEASASLVRDRGQAALIAAAVAAAVACGIAMLDRRRRFPFGGREGPVALAAWTLAMALAAGLFVSVVGRPDTWISSRWNEFTAIGSTASPPPSDATHFGTGVSNRYDYWRVAWRTFEDDPIQGVGAGAFSVPWFRLRSIDENVTDAHSWQAGALAETGLVGLAFAGAVLLLPLARIRTARVSRGAWPIAAVALGGAGVYFVLHASLDWLFRIPAVAIPGFVVLGALATGGGQPGRPMFAGATQRAAVAGAAAIVLTVATLAYLSTAAVTRGETEAAKSTQNALADLDEASRLNPFATEPLLVRATILQLDGRSRAALAAADKATERAPQNWAAWLVLARARQSIGDRVGTRSALNRVATLNPRAARQAGVER
jgi:O-Antigen ligase